MNYRRDLPQVPESRVSFKHADRETLTPQEMDTVEKFRTLRDLVAKVNEKVSVLE